MQTKPFLPAVRTFVAALIAAVLTLSIAFIPSARAADHGDAPALAHDQGADIADLYFFLDPTDNTQVVLIGTFHGFIVPGEAVNFAHFDPALRFHFDIFTDHVNLAPDDVVAKKIKPNRSIDVTFARRVGSSPQDTASGKEILQVAQPQEATVQFTGFDGIKPKDKFTATALNPSLSGSAPSQAGAVTDLGETGVKFFAGEVDDPFFFDIPGFARFINSVRIGAPDGTLLDRGRDTFAGYNVLAIAMRMPVSMLKGSGAKIGATFQTQRHNVETPKGGEVKGVGSFKTVDRIGVPGVNVAFIPFNRKNAYNAAIPKDDASGAFAGSDDGIVATLTALGTDAAHIGILAQVAVTYGDMLILDTSVANTQTGTGGGGDNQGAGFPNGRRLMDDVIDTVLFLVTNETLTTGDHVNASDILPNNSFPFVAPSQQPRDPGVLDDNTRN
jgi:hypothetical protein